MPAGVLRAAVLAWALVGNAVGLPERKYVRSFDSPVSMEMVQQQSGMLLFGGHDQQGVLSDIQAFGTSSEMDWWANCDDWDTRYPSSKVTNLTNSGLVSASSVVYKGELYLFGGSNPQPPDGSGAADYNTLFKLHLETMEWTQLKTTGEKPDPRAEHTAVLKEYEHRVLPEMIVFGGSKIDGTLFNDVHTLDLVTLEWKQIITNGDVPVKIKGHSAVTYGNKMVVFGGTTANGEDSGATNDTLLYPHSIETNTVMELDTESWLWTTKESALGPSITAPPNITGHSAVVHKEAMYIYGGLGWDETTDGFAGSHNIWMYDLSTNEWDNINEYSTSADVDLQYLGWWGRFKHRAAMYSGEMFISGGGSYMRRDQSDMCKGYGVFSVSKNKDVPDICILTDVLALNLDTMTWRIVQPFLSPARYGHIMVPFVVGPKFEIPDTDWHSMAMIIVTILFFVEVLTIIAIYHYTDDPDDTAVRLKPYTSFPEDQEQGGLVMKLEKDPLAAEDSLNGRLATEPSVTPRITPRTRRRSSSGRGAGGFSSFAVPPGIGGAVLAVLCLTFLCATGLLQEWSLTEDGHYPYRVTSAVFVTEFGKLLISVPGLYQQIKQAESPDAVAKMLSFQSEEFVWYWVPALLFALKNILSYTVVAQLGAGVARVAAQLKILFTGLLYDTLARSNMSAGSMRRLTQTEWLGLIILFFAEVLAAGQSVTDSDIENNVQVLGIVGAVMMGIAATLGNLSNEIIVKHSGTAANDGGGKEQSVFLQNMILYIYTSTTCLVMWVVEACVLDISKDIFHGWDYRTACVVIFQIMSGQFISFVLKFQDNITYTVINVLSITATAIGASFLFGDVLSFDFLMACAFVSLSCYLMYAKKLDQEPKVKVDQETPDMQPVTPTSTAATDEGEHSAN